MHLSVLLFLSNLFSSDMIIIVFVALLLFGGEKLPEIARGLGKGIRDFKDASEGVKREINAQINNFEIKREEETKNDQITINQHDAPNNPAENLDPLVESRIPENTIPVSDNIFIEDKHADIEHNTENNIDHKTDIHVSTYTHTDTPADESDKHSS
ncbi:MAG TPA: twin-arginine translocase TatA/TatE family subunit [Mucilaginibacter sp.]|jgi:sec-independent protein translocase protein TatA|nr:twin-arginine translocase TatA/TatE family subunit [Mucilaginibacter sp.]